MRATFVRALTTYDQAVVDLDRFINRIDTEEARQVLRGLASQQEHFLDPGEVDHRRQHREVKEGRALVLDGHDTAHRQALGKYVPLPGGHEDVAHDDTPRVRSICSASFIATPRE